MADLDRETDDRAQLLIVAAVGFAIILIALALTLNTAVYGNVHVSQADSSSFDERDVKGYEKSVQRGLATVLPLTAANKTQVRDTFEEEVELWENLTRDQYIRDDVATGVSVANVTSQDRIIQDDRNRTFEDQSGNPGWSVVSNVSEDVRVQMTIRNGSLATNERSSFTLEVSGANGGSWNLSASSTNSTDIVVEINGTNTRQYTANTSSVQIDVANGVFNETGDRETFESFIRDDAIQSPYELRYENADNVTGTYELVDDTLDIDENNYGKTGSPRVDAQIVAATVTARYQSPELTYRSVVRVSVGETDE